MKSKNYCVTAKLKKKDFNEVVQRFPDFFEKLKQHSRLYQDDRKKQLTKAVRGTSYIEHFSDYIMEEMIYTLRQEQFEDGNVIFREGDTSKGIMYVMEGGIDLSHSEDGEQVVIDTLLTGSQLFSYTCLTDERIKLTGVALGKTTVLVLPYETLEAARSTNDDFDNALKQIEEYLMTNGNPYCDYTRHRVNRPTPIVRFRAAVKKIKDWQRMERGGKIHIMDCMNVLREQKEKEKSMHFRSGEGISLRGLSLEGDEAELAVRLTKKLKRLNTQLQEQEKFMQALRKQAFRQRNHSSFSPQNTGDTIEKLVPLVDPNAVQR